MYSAEYFKDKRIIVTDSDFEECNNKRTIITEVKDFGNGKMLFKTEIPHPHEKSGFVWIGLFNIKAILEFDGVIKQYRHKETNQTLTLSNEYDNIEKEKYNLIGHFDVYKKIPIILT